MHKRHPPIAYVRAALALALGTVSLWGWTLFAGKDLSWDVLNHHIYLPFSLLSGRFATDLFAAGPQSYQNPLGYLPFHAFLSTGSPDWAVGLGLASLHAAAAWPLWRLAQRIWPDGEGERWWRWMAMAMAWISPSFLLVAGTSSVDPLTNVLVLFALAWTLADKPRLRLAAGAGALLGLAFAIKPTNAVYVLACAAVLLFRAVVASALRPGLGQLAMFSFAAAAMAAVAMGPWALWLWREFQNPLFPLFNQWFGSPYAPLEPIIADRFLGASAAALWQRLWDFALPQGMVHTEVRAPDLRPAALTLLLLVLATRSAWQHLRGTGGMRGAHGISSARAVGGVVSERPLPEHCILLFLAVAYVLWMATSGNSRYAVSWFMLVGLALVRVAQHLLAQRVARIALGVLLALHALNYAVNGEMRFGTPVRWTGDSYLHVVVPPRLRDQPVLHLSLGTPSHSAVVPSLHPHGAFINATGIFSLPTEGPLGEMLHQRLDRWSGRIRVLSVGQIPLGDGAEARQYRARHDRVVYRFGLQIDWDDCLALQLPMSPVRARVAAGATAKSYGIPLMSCRAVPRVTVDSRYDADRAQAERAFHVLERQCPRIFGPSPMATNADLGAWRRFYMNSDARAVVSPTDGVSVSAFSSWKVAYLGSMEEVIAGRGKPACQAWKELSIE